MTDFFTRLAERTLGLASTIQPLLPSRFEPGSLPPDAEQESKRPAVVDDRHPQPRAAQRFPPTFETDRPLEQAAIVQQPQSAHGTASRSLVSRLDNQAGLISDPATQPGKPLSQLLGSDPRPIDPRWEDSRPIERRAVPPTSPEQPVTDPSEPIARRVDDSRQSAQPSTRRPPNQPSSASQSPRPRLLLPPEPPDRAERIRPIHPAPPAAEPAVLRSDPRSTQSMTAQPELVAREQTMQRIPPWSPEPSAAQPAPQIHVSIGRIEIRAVTPQPEPAPTPPPTPRMSLDEYLRSQNGGRR